MLNLIGGTGMAPRWFSLKYLKEVTAYVNVGSRCPRLLQEFELAYEYIVILLNLLKVVLLGLGAAILSLSL
ncbi:hypothetical protein CMV_030437 [Castanea mollissima]|uniref:Uncharacterized protein n=1 Tax=Castanea mollissima TaxID=60419 RepID=A0A8J4Q492_9ROSI|nr:hypothetical protein CMV_030437 [Castanea mollissima]